MLSVFTVHRLVQLQFELIWRVFINLNKCLTATVTGVFLLSKTELSSRTTGNKKSNFTVVTSVRNNFMGIMKVITKIKKDLDSVILVCPCQFITLYDTENSKLVFCNKQLKSSVIANICLPIHTMSK